MIKNPNVITLQLWPCAIHYAVDVLNNFPNSSGFSQRETFTGAKDNRNKKNHAFGSPTFSLDPTIQRRSKLPTWIPRSIQS